MKRPSGLWIMQDFSSVVQLETVLVEIFITNRPQGDWVDFESKYFFELVFNFGLLYHFCPRIISQSKHTFIDRFGRYSKLRIEFFLKHNESNGFLEIFNGFCR